jgi:hypothetical protein
MEPLAFQQLAWIVAVKRSGIKPHSSSKLMDEWGRAKFSVDNEVEVHVDSIGERNEAFEEAMNNKSTKKMKDLVYALGVGHDG